MKGYWLSRVDGIFATGKNPYSFDKLCQGLERKGNNPHVRQYFVPQNECTEQYRAKNLPIQLDDKEEQQQDILTQLQNNVDFNDEVQLQSINAQYKRARIDQVKTSTKKLKQELLQRKRQLFYQWSNKFFDAFANHFGKLKNTVVQMHLNAQQVTKFNQMLDSSLTSLQVNLDQIYNEFMDQKDEKEV